ncbi:hypothetical protein [Kribbella catacumbae]|uniref:hypothetical protein n=1 Tax=Kribbella catacumbae TaxID=460086 RepID=UPI0012FAD929|nr:hypothetical protein [Kribbella catacumbae]
MTGRGFGRALLGSGLLVVTLLGGAGGYGLGLLTTDQRASAGVAAAPLAPAASAKTTTPPPKKLIPDDSEPLQAEDIRYKTREFTVIYRLESRVKVRVPGNWDPALQDPPKEMRFNEPARKRLVRIQAGFTIERPPEESMDIRIGVLKALSADQMVTIKSRTVDPVTQHATLVYTYAEKLSLRHVITRWVANKDGLCAFEIGVSGLPQDKAALEEILDRAAESATRSDSPLN